jgi:predicted nuclease with RNAse H fold
MYVGLDIGGTENTWTATLCPSPTGIEIVDPPRRSKLLDVVGYCASRSVLAVAIDAQLTAAVSEDNGFRSSDEELRTLLPEDCRNWVVSSNSLMAVPARGRLIAEKLSTDVPTIVETHPRASLLFCLGPEYLESVKSYKSPDRSLAERHSKLLTDAWLQRWKIARSNIQPSDGAVDSLVCATVAYALHWHPATLFKLKQLSEDRVGRGPFYVFKKHKGLPA